MTDPLGGQSAATGDGQSANAGDQGAGNAANAGAQGGAGTTGTPTPEGGQGAVSREEFDRLRAQLAAADQKRTQAEQQFAQLRDKDMPQLQKLERDFAESQAALAERDAVISNMRIENAFLTDNTHDWHNPSAAMQLLDRSRITVDSEGKVVGMKDALQALARAHPYLLKPAPTGEAQGGAGTTATPGPGTGPTNGGIAPNAGTKPSQAELTRRFPAMKQRLG